MGLADGVAAAVERAVERAVSNGSRLVLAVSGGRDSMVLLDAVARIAPECVACVATFDHGTGPAAAEAAALVARRSRELGLSVRPGHLGGGGTPRREAAWRDARWRFLHEVARDVGAAVATAHTRDDQVETVFMRALRGAGARGLAGLYARSALVRPLLDSTRQDVADYARAWGVEWMEDPSNQSRRHLRNRTRLDLLPLLERARPGLADELLALAVRAGRLREDVDEYLKLWVPARIADGALLVARAELQGYDAAGLGIIWPALAARLGVVLDRRGTERITEFTIKARAGARIQLSGGWEVVLHRETVVLRRARAERELLDALPLEGAVTTLGRWQFRPLSGLELESLPAAGVGKWRSALPADGALRVRPWSPGDRMTPHGASAPRRVKGLFRDAGVDAVRRVGWPVVLAGDEIVWIPGVRHGAASTVLSHRPVVVYECECHDF